MFVLHSPLFTILKDVSFNRLITSINRVFVFSVRSGCLVKAALFIVAHPGPSI